MALGLGVLRLNVQESTAFSEETQLHAQPSYENSIHKGRPQMCEQGSSKQALWHVSHLRSVDGIRSIWLPVASLNALSRQSNEDKEDE